MRTVVLGGAWSSNIGNAFYNLGAEWLVRRIQQDAIFFPESPRWKFDVKRDFDPIGELDCELVVLVGPCLNRRLEFVYGQTFEKLYERGVMVGYISAGMGEYSEEEAEKVGAFLLRFPPRFISTRDDATLEMIRPFSKCPTFSGLCTSMFLNDAINPPHLKGSKRYIVLNFDSNKEPEFIFDTSGTAIKTDRTAKHPPLEVNGYRVIRTSNLGIDKGVSEIYRKPSTYHSDLPLGYCSILQGAECVYSERVHTCAAALILGSKVQFVQHSARSFEKRNLLFDRIGVKGIFKTPCQLDMAFIAKEKLAMTTFLRQVLS